MRKVKVSQYGQFSGGTKIENMVSIVLAWDANIEPDLVGYKIYYGTSSPPTQLYAIIGVIPTYTVQLIYQQYYFDVTAYNSSGLESPVSNIVAYIE